MREWTEADQRRQAESLEKVLATVRDLTRRQVSSLVIFDLDGTVLDNRPRTHYILRELAENWGSETPQLSAAFERMPTLESVQYSLVETLAGMGVTDALEVERVRREWAKRFFSDAYQRFDFPVPGARAFVDEVHQAGATVIYLTGRDVERMLVGTTESLRQYGFPVGIKGTMTIVKSEIETEDEEFKKETVAYLKRLGSVVAVFENEPGNANMLKREFPYADSLLVLTQHRPDAPPPDDSIIPIRDFRLRAAT